MQSIPGTYGDEQLAFLSSAGFTTGTINDRWFSYWASLSGISNGTITDHILAALKTYPGTFLDKLKAWCGGSGTLNDCWYLKLTSGGSTPEGQLLYNGDTLIYNGDNLVYN